jgi:hypothetical protein
VKNGSIWYFIGIVCSGIGSTVGLLNSIPLRFQNLVVLNLDSTIHLELCHAVRNVKKSPNQETGLGNRGRLKDLYDTKLVLSEHE